ncbi:MAG: DUF885 domain-containing protein [Phycisphaerales bacterium]|nr:DUF885 domain-containing protein [Phycisphaerales bacterium]
MIRRIASITGILLLLAAAPASAEPPTPYSPAARLHALFDAEWDWTMQENPTWASSLGDRRWNDRWPDVSPAAHERRQAHRKATLEQLQTVDRAALSPADQLNYDLFQDQLSRAIEDFEFGWPLSALNQRGGIQTEYELADRLRFETLQDYLDYEWRLAAFPVYVDQTIELMREGIRRGIVHPKIIMQRVPGQIAQVLTDDPTANPFFKPFAGQGSAADLQRRAELIERHVVPAMRKFKQFFEEEYLPACLDNVGIWQLPRGDRMYSHFARRYTTTRLTPDEIHELGLREVARISAEMDQVMKEVGFQGTRPEFFHFLRTDPRFFYRTGEELLAATRALCKTIDPKLVKLFKTIPRMPYGVEPIPMEFAPDTTTAYYQGPALDGSRAGTYYVNLYKPETRPRWEMVALSLHEAVPGHHFQISRALELGEMPKFRRHAGYTAYIEGWALYCESLGEELGLYADPYDRFGKLTYEMWRAVRLVVDTGIHHKRWSRQQAIDYFLAHAPKSELDIVNEIDRYIAWPGQALAYKIGELKIRELRTRAETALGSRFDIRQFHDVILGSGAVPLDALERIVEDWIVRTGS